MSAHLLNKNDGGVLMISCNFFKKAEGRMPTTHFHVQPEMLEVAFLFDINANVEKWIDRSLYTYLFAYLTIANYLQKGLIDSYTLHIYLSTYLFMYLSTYLLIYLSVYLLIYSSTYLLIYSSTYLHIEPSTYLHIHIYTYTNREGTHSS